MGAQKGGSLMGSWEEGSGFRIVGTIKRLWFAQSMKVAEVTVNVVMHPHPAEFRLKTFDRALIGDLKRDLREGQRVKFTGRIENEKLKDRSGAEVMADGRQVWVDVLRPKAYEVEGSSRAPAPRGDQRAREPGADDGPPADPMGGAANPMGGNDPMGGGSDPFGS